MELKRVYQTEKREVLPKVNNNCYSSNPVRMKKIEKNYSIVYNNRTASYYYKNAS